MAQLEYRGSKFASRAWKMIRRDPGWYKPLLVMSAAMLVPIVGYLGNQGYAYEWARITAWGQESAPKQKGVQVGACIKSGFRAAVILLIWGLVMTVLTVFTKMIPEPTLNMLLGMVVWVISLFWSLAAALAALVATVYQRFGAGFAFKRIWSMIKADTSGFFRLWWSNFLFSLIIGVIAVVVSYALIFPSIGMVAGGIAYLVSAHDLSTSVWMLSQVLNQLTLPVALLIITTNILTSVTTLMTPTMVALWVMQFDVTNWGEPNEAVITHAAVMPALPDNPMVAPVAPQDDVTPQQEFTSQTSDSTPMPVTPGEDTAPEGPIPSQSGPTFDSQEPNPTISESLETNDAATDQIDNPSADDKNVE